MCPENRNLSTDARTGVGAATRRSGEANCAFQPALRRLTPSGKRNCGKSMVVEFQLSRPFSESLIVHNMSIFNLQWNSRWFTT